MKLLAIETATLQASVALVEGERVLAHTDRPVSTHSDILLTMIDETLQRAGAGAADLDGVAVGAGPGSFTGLRIGMATAKGLCFARELPLWTVSSLAALALEAGPRAGLTLVPIIDAKKGEVFAAAFRHEPGQPLREIAEPRALDPDALRAWLLSLDAPAFFGTGAQTYLGQIGNAGTHLGDTRLTPSAESVAKLALTAEKQDDLRTAVPTYVRRSEAELKWRGGD